MEKKGLELETLGKWIIVLLVLAIIVLGIMLLRGRGEDIMNKIMWILRFGR